MAKGKKLKTPVEEKAARRYRTRRDKNNESAARHRERTKQALEDGKRYKELYDQLVKDLHEKEAMLAEVESEKADLLDFLLTHECVSSRTHREQLCYTFYRSRPLLRSARTSDCCSPPSFTPPLMQQNQPMMTRPTDFCIDNFQPLSKATVPLANVPAPNQTHCENNVLPAYKDFDHFLASKTGFTPAPGAALADLSNSMPWSPAAPCDYRNPQSRLNPDQYTPFGQYFVTNCLEHSDTLSNLSEEDLCENLSYVQL